MTTTTSRRAVLAGIPAATAAVAVPVVAVTAGELTFPELARAWANAYRRWLPFHNRNVAQLEWIAAETFARTGLKETPCWQTDRPAFDQWSAVHSAVCSEVPRNNEEESEHEATFEQLFALMQKIMSQKAVTLADLAVQASVAAQWQFVNDPELSEIGADNLMVLVDAIGRLAGVDPLPGIQWDREVQS